MTAPLPAARRRGEEAQAPRLYVRVSDAPTTFAVSTDTIYRAAKRGELTIYKPVGVALLRVAEVEAWIAGRSR